MNWIEALYRTYENCSGLVGDVTQDPPLLPVAHTTQNAQIEVVLDGNANFRAARILPKNEQKTLVPCTEQSGGRTGSKPVNHPLCDKLQYLAGDFLDFGCKVTSGFAKTPKEPHELYIKSLRSWCNSHHSQRKVQIILEYVLKGTLIRDLIESSVLHCNPENNTLLNKWSDEQNDPPEIFGALPQTSTQQDAFVRWIVEVPGDPEPRIWEDHNVWNSWISYYENSLTTQGLCYVLGRRAFLASQHPAKIRHAADKAKLISSNDGSGFTFRGRFTDKDGEQVCGVSFEVSQKAHNALRWLVARQGRRDGDQAIVAWAISGKPLPSPVAATDDILGIDENESGEEDFLAEDGDEDSTALSHAETGQDFALRLKHKIGGYTADLGSAEQIVVLALDSATPGRMAITYYRELASSEFLDRIETWHRECAWFQNFGKKRKFTGAPAPADIAHCAYGSRADGKLLASTQQRLLRSIVDAEPIPRDLVENCIRKAIARQSSESWEWEKYLGIACSLYRKQQTDNNKHKYAMSLERDRTTRDYLYGRLLAVADHLEASALRIAKENRDTNAARLMQRFADHPYTTWRTIELSLDPYQKRLRSNAPGLLNLYEKEIEQIMELFDVNDFNYDAKLGGEFLLAFHVQRKALWTKQPKNSDSEPTASE